MGGEFGGAAGYFLLRLGGVLLVFVPCLWAAIRRSKNAAPQNRALGIILSALVPMAGYPLYFGGLSIVIAPVLLIYVGFFVLRFIALPAFLSAIVADVVLRLLGATRTPVWLLIGIAAALAMTIFWLAWTFGSQPVFLVELVLEYVLLSLIPASSALIWWAYLPPEPEDVASTFD